MLSYRHAFHAGSFADVVKHAILVQVLRHVVRKPKPVYVLDTHAGAGSYRLDTPMALKTGEFRAGIGRLLAAPGPWPELVAPYLELVRAANPGGELRCYPGSPALARALLRSQDRLELVELHGTDHALLAASAAAAPREEVVRADGLAAAGSADAAAGAPRGRPDRPELRGQDGLSGRGGGVGPGASPLCDRHLPALVSGDRTVAGHGAAATTCGPPASRASFASSSASGPTPRSRHDGRRRGGDQPAMDAACGGGRGLPWLAAALGADGPVTASG